jgi:hypothetical protein
MIPAAVERLLQDHQPLRRPPSIGWMNKFSKEHLAGIKKRKTKPLDVKRKTAQDQDTIR